MASLRDKTISGVFWSFLQKIGDRGIQFFVTIILARLLTPEDFGLIGMLAIFIAISQSLVEAGFNKALIQKKDADEEDFSSVFYINLISSIILYLILYAGAPLIADFYSQPKLINLTRVLSLVFIFNAFGYVQETKLVKNIQFKKLMIIHLPSTLISGLVAIIMAYKGCGVWSIVAQRLVMRLIFVLQMWLYSPWKPLRVFNLQKAKLLFSFGSNLMIVGVIQTIYLNAYKVVIGKIYPANMLGYYENANSLASTPVSTIASVISGVTFPVFSTIQNDNKRLKSGYKKTIQQVLFILSPVLFLSIALAEPLFRLVLTEKWLPAVPFFQILCVGFIFSPLSRYNAELINIKGRSKLFLKLDLIKKIIETAGIIISVLFFDIWALIWFQSLFTIVKFLINGFYSGKFINYSTTEQLKDIMGILIIGGLNGILIYIMSNLIFTDFSDFIKLIVGYGSGFLIYYGTVRILALEAYLDARELMNVFLTKIKS